MEELVGHEVGGEVTVEGDGVLRGRVRFRREYEVIHGLGICYNYYGGVVEGYCNGFVMVYDGFEKMMLVILLIAQYYIGY